jgi:hypothetical protein
MRPEVVRGGLAERDGARRRRDPFRLGFSLACQRIDAVCQQLAHAPTPLARRRQAEDERAAETVVMLFAVELVAPLPVGGRRALCYEIQAARVQMPTGLTLADQLGHALRCQCHPRLPRKPPA